MPLMRIALVTGLLLVSTASVQSQVYSRPYGYWLDGRSHRSVYEHLIRRDQRHPPTINGIELGNLLPEGSIWPPASAWSDVEELKLLPAPRYTDYSTGNSGMGSDSTATPGSTSVDTQY